MTKRIFQDLLDYKKRPKLWRYFVISLIWHGIFLYALSVIPLAPPDTSAVYKPVKPADSAAAAIYDKTGDSSEPVGFFSKSSASDFQEEATSAIVSERRKKSPDRETADNIQTRTVDNEALARPVDLTEPEVTAPTGTVSNKNNNVVHAAGAAPPDPVHAQQQFQRKPGPAAVFQYKRPAISRDLVDTDEYIQLYNKPFQSAFNASQSTFSLKVGTMSYPTIRRAIRKMEIPYEEEVKIEEMINYFYYDYPQPKGDRPISVITELGPCPWNPNTRLLHIGLKGKVVFGNGLKDSTFTIAEDVKILVKFNPGLVKGYRLLGYGRQTPKVGPWEFHKGRGSNMWAGQRITSLYEYIPMSPEEITGTEGKETAVVTVTYKKPMGAIPQEIVRSVFGAETPELHTTENFDFSSAVAFFGMMLRNPDEVDIKKLDELLQMAENAKGEDKYGHRQQFIQLVKSYKGLIKNKK